MTRTQFADSLAGMFGKVFSQMYSGSMVGSGLEVFAVWTYAIANADADGFVEINPVLLGAILGCEAKQVTRAIDRLMAPDPASRSKEREGRRMIREGEFLYWMPNYRTYREMRSQEDRREYNRIKQRETRAKRRAGIPTKKERRAADAHDEFGAARDLTTPEDRRHADGAQGLRDAQRNGVVPD